MKKNQTLKTPDGIEVALFPLDVLRITQGYQDSVLWVSHEKTKAIDCTGTHAKYPIYMPVTAKCIGKYDLNKGNGVLWESVDKVLFANGDIDYMHFVVWHDDNISDFAIGQVFKQGQECQDTGHNGIGSGDHTHLEFGKGRAPVGRYPLVAKGGRTHFDVGRNISTYTLQNAIRPEDAVFINDTKIISNPWNNKFKTYKESDFMKSGWIWDTNLKEQTYYENNKMAKNNWKQEPDGSWYWLKEDGRMARNEALEINGSMRFFWKSGQLATIENTQTLDDGSLRMKK